ncbi:MAG: hypothetical protein AAGF13_07130 [Pseudomonadota bacterium]
MAEIGFLTSIANFLASSGAPTPAFADVGFGVPVAGDTFPIATLSLPQVERVDIGMGGGVTEVSEGSIEVVSTIDLADPILPGSGGFSLLDGTRTQLTLPHGGLIRADAVEAALAASDVTVSVGATDFALVAASPEATEFSADPITGQLTFGAALPAAGILEATYHLGIWERETTLIRGVLHLGVWDSDTTQLINVSNQAVQALVDRAQAIDGLQKIALTSLSEIGEPQPVAPVGRQRSAHFAFEYEHIVDRPMSSGGIIARVATTSRLTAFTRDPGTGAMTETTVTETDD